MGLLDRFRSPEAPKPKSTGRSPKERKRAAARSKRYRAKLREKKSFEAASTLGQEVSTASQIASNAQQRASRDCVKNCGRKATRQDRQGYCEHCWLVAVARILAEPLPLPEIPELTAELPHHLKTRPFDPDADSRAIFGHGVAFAADHGDYSPHEGMKWHGNPSERAELEQQQKRDAYLNAGGQVNGINDQN